MGFHCITQAQTIAYIGICLPSMSSLKEPLDQIVDVWCGRAVPFQAKVLIAAVLVNRITLVN